jgi:hypothetical protein
VIEWRHGATEDGAGGGIFMTGVRFITAPAGHHPAADSLPMLTIRQLETALHGALREQV